jgi:hypothetical protein
MPTKTKKYNIERDLAGILDDDDNDSNLEIIDTPKSEDRSSRRSKKKLDDDRTVDISAREPIGDLSTLSDYDESQPTPRTVPRIVPRVVPKGDVSTLSDDELLAEIDNLPEPTSRVVQNGNGEAEKKESGEEKSADGRKRKKSIKMIKKKYNSKSKKYNSKSKKKKYNSKSKKIQKSKKHSDGKKKRKSKKRSIRRRK